MTAPRSVRLWRGRKFIRRPLPPSAQTTEPESPPSHPPAKAQVHAPPLWRQLRHHLHHLQVALAVASIVGLLHGFGYLGWLDAAMLRLAGAEGAAVASSAAPPDMPETLLIDEAMFERDFEQRSPLDRDKLARLLQALLSDPALAPKVLVIDLDVSDNGQDPAQRSLDELLGRAVRSGLHLVLAAPPWLNSAETLIRKSTWMRSLRAKACTRDPGGPAPRGSLTFASSLVTNHANVVLQYAQDELTLGTAASRLACAPGTCGQTDEALTALLDSSRGVPKPVAALMPFNAQFFGAVASHTRRLQSLDAPLGLPGPGKPAVSLAGKVTFLGGSYDPRDRFSAPLALDGKPMEGVELHAATFYSALHPVTQASAWLAWGADVMLGFVCGWVFQLLWAGQVKVAGWPGWRGYFVPKLMLVLTLATAALLAWIAVLAAAHWFYPNNYWISPGPVVLGVFAKLLLTALHGGGDHDADHANDHAAQAPQAGHIGFASDPAAARERMDWLIVGALVLACMITISLHH